MKTEQFDHILQSTLDDGRLSRSERQALEQVLEEQTLETQQRALLRSRVFAMARQAVAGVRDRQVIDWMEQVLKVVIPLEEIQPASSQVYFSPGDDCVRCIKDLLRKSVQSVDLCVFTITDDRISKEIGQAHRRGVRVRLITDDDKSLDRGSDIEELERLGVPVRTDASEHHMHHKFAVFDAHTLLTGSYNWTRSAADYNYENVLVTDSGDLVGPYRQKFQELWNNLKD